MRDVRIVLVLLCVQLCAAAAYSQTAKFDLLTYTAPAGWTVDKDPVSIRFTKESGESFCVISLTRSADSGAESAANFRALWQAMAVDGLNANVEPQMGQPGNKDGWAAEMGLAPFEKDGLKGAALLTTFTGNGKVVAVLAITNSGTFEKDIEAFVDNLKLPFIASGAQGSQPARPVARVEADSKLIGRWQRSTSGQPKYADPASWGTAGYTKSRYEFNTDGTYAFTERSFRMSYDKIIVVKETGRYTINGETISIAPSKSVIQSYKKAGGTDALGALVSTQNRQLEKATYRFTLHYFEGIKEWNLVLQADRETDRDGRFSGNKLFENAWYFDQKFTDTDLTATRVN